MIIRFIKNLILKYGFGRKSLRERYPNADWQTDDFFTAHRAKTLRLAEIARERTKLKEQLTKAIKWNKERASIYQALRALSVEELNIEVGK